MVVLRPRQDALRPVFTASSPPRRPAASAPPAAPRPARRAGARRRRALVRIPGAEHLERRHRRLGQRLEVVAAFEHHAERHVELLGQAAHARRHLRVALAGDAAAGERIARVRVVAGGDEHQPGPVLEPERDHDVLDQRAPRRVAGPGGHRQVDRVALAAPRPRVARPARCRDTAATGGCSRRARRDRAWKMSLVPLPWWTSQSRIRTRSAPAASSARRAATATLLKRQKPIARAGLRVVSGRSVQRGAEARASPPSSASTSAAAPPAACSAAR